MAASMCSVDPGLYVVRYLSSDRSGHPPAAEVKPAGGCERDIEVVMSPGDRMGVLGGPGSNLVLVVHRPSTLEILVGGHDASASVDARFKVECLARRDPGRTQPPMPQRIASPDRTARAVEPSGTGVVLTAHVQRRGDVEVADGAWVSGPDDPVPIEGLSCRCTGAGIGIGIQFMNTLSGRWSPWHEAQAFAGTRRKASPVTALRLRLEGPDAARFAIVAEAMFLESPGLVREGADVILLGNGMMDPLVGLRLGLKEIEAVRPAAAPPGPSRVRVFRSDGSTDRSPPPTARALQQRVPT